LQLLLKIEQLLEPHQMKRLELLVLLLVVGDSAMVQKMLMLLMFEEIQIQMLGLLLQLK
jgi:hypothetical protein